MDYSLCNNVCKVCIFCLTFQIWTARTSQTITKSSLLKIIIKSIEGNRLLYQYNMDQRIVCLSNIEEIKNQIVNWSCPKTRVPKPPLPHLSKNTEYVRRGVKASRSNKKLFLKCGVDLSNLSVSINHPLLFKKPRICLRKKTCVPRINLRVWPDDFPHFKRYIYGMYLLDLPPFSFHFTGVRSVEDNSYQVNIKSSSGFTSLSGGHQ